jgi:Spy/CpxP family protein refolding chaperone
MKKRNWIVLLSAISVLFWGQIGEADSGKHKHAHGEKRKHACYERSGIHRGGYIHAYIGMYKEHGKELGLSQEQIDKMAAIDKECDAACNKLSEEVESAESALDALVKGDVINMKVVSDKIKEVHDLRGKLEIAHFELLSKAQQILTPEQREKCRKFCEKKTGKEWPMIH